VILPSFDHSCFLLSQRPRYIERGSEHESRTEYGCASARRSHGWTKDGRQRKEEVDLETKREKIDSSVGKGGREEERGGRLGPVVRASVFCARAAFPDAI